MIITPLPRWLRDFAPLVLWKLFIFYLSAQSRFWINIENELFETIFFETCHAVVYAILGWLWWRALSPDRKFTWSTFCMALGMVILYALSDEYHQLYVPGRAAETADVLLDTAGGLAALLLIRRSEWARRFPENLLLFLKISLTPNKIQ
jgi:VanZ family protein